VNVTSSFAPCGTALLVQRRSGAKRLRARVTIPLKFRRTGGAEFLAVARYSLTEPGP